MRRRIGRTSRRSVAERAGRWSAQHRRAAIVGWIGFVLVAFLLGGSLGQRYLRDEQMGNGDSQRALQAYAAADFPEFASEQVLVQGRSPGVRVADAEFRAGVRDVAARLRAAPFVMHVRSPLERANRGQVS